MNKDNHPLQGIVLPMRTVLVLSTVGCICKISEVNIYQEFASNQGAFIHIVIGAISFLGTLIVVLWEETFLRKPVMTFLQNNKLTNYIVNKFE